jgi:hypothetical protein
MRAGIAQGEGLAQAVTADDERNLQQSCLVQLVAMNPIGGQGAIPEAGQHERVGRLALWEIEFGHGGIFDC